MTQEDEQTYEQEAVEAEHEDVVDETPEFRATVEVEIQANIAYKLDRAAVLAIPLREMAYTDRLAVTHYYATLSYSRFHVS